MRNDADRTDANRSALAAMSRRAKDEEQAGASLSGHERNRLFLNRGGADFVDASGVSGMDDPADGRAFAVLDYDRDGFSDVAVVNSNAPWLELFRNEGGVHPALGAAKAGRIVLRFVGGNDTPYPSKRWSSRDGVGALATLDVGGRQLVRELRFGEGFASQNSSTLLVGLGDAPEAKAIRVRWPSGSVQSVGAVPKGTLVTVYENPAQSPTGEAFVLEPYATFSTRNAPPKASVRPTLGLPSFEGGRGAAALVLYTTMATWCVACREELPSLRRLRAALEASELAMYGVPIDVNESSALIEAWVAENDPVYAVRTDLGREETQRVKDLVMGELKLDAVPASILTDAAGNVLRVQWGPPSLSKLRELLRAVRAETPPASSPPTQEKVRLHP